MGAKITHFKVGNGDQTLIRLDSGRRLLIDCNVRVPSKGEKLPDVIAQLRKRLDRDAQGRLFVDAFLLTHPDQDHCRGLRDHFHLGPLDDWDKGADKVVIREMWSSPMVFRRASKKHALCDDAKAWNTEARRRVRKFRSEGVCQTGDRIQIFGEDEGEKTDDLRAILVPRGAQFSRINGERDATFLGTLIAPAPPGEEVDEDMRSKNNSSVIINLSLNAGFQRDAARYLFGGDAEVGIWEAIWDEFEDNVDVLEYDVLIAPHHCSWRSLSWDSWSDKGEKAVVSQKARKALSQKRLGACVIASSKIICDDDSDPPCTRAEREYKDIVGAKKFECLADDAGDEPVEFDIKASGPVKVGMAAAVVTVVSTAAAAKPFQHG